MPEFDEHFEKGTFDSVKLNKYFDTADNVSTRFDNIGNKLSKTLEYGVEIGKITQTEKVKLWNRWEILCKEIDDIANELTRMLTEGPQEPIDEVKPDLDFD